MTKNKQNKIFYSNDESSEEEETPVHRGTGYSKTGKTDDEQHSFLHAILVPGPTEDRSFAANKAPECNRYKTNEVTAPPRPRIGEPAAQRGTVDLGTDSGEENRTAHSTASGRHATCLLEGLTKMTLRDLIKLEMRLNVLEHKLKETDERVRNRDHTILQMQRQLAASPSPNGGARAPACLPRHQRAPHTAPRKGTSKTYSCRFCNFLVGTHDTEHCFRNPQRVSRPTPSGRGRARL